MIRSACVVCFALLYIFVVGAPLLVYTLLSGNTDLIYRAGVLGATMTVRLAGARLEVVGREKIERTRAVVFMANHQSNCDPPALIGLLPPVLILGKEEFFRVPILGLAMRLRGFIPVDRWSREKSIQAINHAADSLSAGRSFLTFPEGTRSPDGRLLPFKKGVFIMAMKAGAPIQPVSISGSRKVMPKGKVAMRAGKVRITFHDLLVTTGTSEISAYQDAVRKAILSGLAEEEWPADLRR
ncbi:MAG TPA: lysophospholipid acyltransferase family protein [Terriglobia bacterium]|nr:lysophospholipid acyltransferase family protein [Terriglobia bacterium]